MFSEKLGLNDQLKQRWQFQGQVWSAKGHLFSAGVDELRLKPALVTEQLVRIDNPLAKGETRDLPPMEVLPGYAIPVNA